MIRLRAPVVLGLVLLCAAFLQAARSSFMRHALNSVISSAFAGKLKEMLSFLPPNLLGRARETPASEEKPERKRKRFDASFFGWEDKEAKSGEPERRHTKEAWWLRSGTFAR